jgi:hypothetical protein
MAAVQSTRVLRAALWATGPAHCTTPPHHVSCSATLTTDGGATSLWTGAHDGSIVRWELAAGREEDAAGREEEEHQTPGRTQQLKPMMYLHGAGNGVSALRVWRPSTTRGLVWIPGYKAEQGDG